MDESNVTAMLPRTKDVMNTKGESTMSQSVYQMYWFLPGDDRVRTLGLGALMAATRALIAVHLPEGSRCPTAPPVSVVSDVVRPPAKLLCWCRSRPRKRTQMNTCRRSFARSAPTCR